jgi:hypothetical protein
MPLYNDLPTLNDRLDWAGEIARMRNRMLECDSPHVFGIHGDWGSGKTSFMRQIQYSLGGDMPADASVDRPIAVLDARQRKEMNSKVMTIWFGFVEQIE